MISDVVPAVKGLSPGEIAAICYADIFGVVLSRVQVKLWSINVPEKLILPALHPDPAKKSFYARGKIAIGQKIINSLSLFPFIEAIFLTGDVATGICAKDSDIDLMVITRPNTLWLTRLLVVAGLKNKKIYKTLICPNIFLDANHLLIKEQNLYTAHEVLQAQCLFDRGGLEKKWLKLNSWAKNYLPNAYAVSLRALAKQSILTQRQIASSLLLLAMTPLELIAFIFQYLYMRSKMTNEKIGLGFAFFHPRKLSSRILQEYQKRLKLAK